MKYGMFGMTFIVEEHIVPQIVHSMKLYSYQLCKMRFNLKCFQKLNTRYLKFFWAHGYFVVKDIWISMASDSVQLVISRESTRERKKPKNKKFQMFFYLLTALRKHLAKGICFGLMVWHWSFLIGVLGPGILGNLRSWMMLQQISETSFLSWIAVHNYIVCLYKNLNTFFLWLSMLMLGMFSESWNMGVRDHLVFFVK